MRTRLTLTLSALLLNACASAGSSADATQAQHVVTCCKTISEADFATFPTDKDVSISVTSADPVFDFDTGPSRFKAYALPPTTRGDPRRLYVRAPEPLISAMFGSHIALHYFFPTVEFLSEGKQLIREPLDGSLDRCEYSECRGLLLSVAVPAGARYVVIYTPASMIGNSRTDAFERGSGLTVPMGKGLLTIPGGSAPRTSIGSPTGDLRVWLVE